MTATPARETIFALSSGSPPAAIAIVRISGPEAGAALVALCRRLPRARNATLVTVRAADGTPIDRALVLWFPGPDTATGEDLAELHLHGGRAVVAAALAALGAIPGCRAARAGEFTRRAFDNGRIDLLQAEGLADLLSAETEGARRHALRLAEGGLSGQIGEWRERLLVLSARAEAVIEFGGDDPDIPEDPDLRKDIAELAGALEESLAVPPAERLRDGIRVLVAGPPNCGKSTLVNALAGRDVAIATPIAGTTRDLLEAPVQLGGIAMVLIDSAGLRSSDDPVEQEGVRRARAAIEAADIILWLGEAGDRPEGTQVIGIHARQDLPGRRDVPPHCDLAISAKTGAGFAALQHELISAAGRLLLDSDLSLSSHQRICIEEAQAEIRSAERATDELLVAEHLRRTVSILDGLTGHSAVEEMLDILFGRFCIGK